MQPLARIVAATSALLCSSPLLAEELTVSDVKAFWARFEAADERCDVDAIVDRISPLAVISGTTLAQGDAMFFRANKQQYGQLMKQTCGQITNEKSTRTNENISIDRDQATITADVATTYTLNGQTISLKSRDKAVIELIDGRLMLVQFLINQTERSVDVASR